VTKLHGGFSGSLVLKTDSYGLDGYRDEPTVTKLDDAESMLEEVVKTKTFTALVGTSAAKVQRGPFLVDLSGDLIDEGAATEKDFGCVVLDMAGACWVMPEFYEKLDTELITTFKQHVVRQLAVERSHEINTDVMVVMQELWGSGGPLRFLSIKTCKRSDTLATQPEGLIEGALCGIITSLIIAFRMPDGAECKKLVKGYKAPLLLDGCITKVLESKPSWLTKDWVSKIDGLQAKKFKHSLVHDCDAAAWRDEDTCKALVGLVEQLESLLEDPTWLVGYKPLRMHQHGDLNCGNILVDVRNSLWLIDFAKAGEQALFVDAAKMVSVILFEQFPVPLTLDDLRRRGGAQKFVDALGASKDQADYLANLATACDSKAALVKRLTADDIYQRFLPFIEDDAVAEQRAKEACDVIDLLFKSDADGQQPQLWEIGERQPPPEWPTYARLALQLCARVLKVTTELVTECSRREQGNGKAVHEDLHPIHFILPLLKRALSTLRYRDCGSWQKRVAWHAARRLAEALTPLLRQPAQPLPAFADRVLATELRLVAGQPIAMLGAAGRHERVGNAEKQGEPGAAGRRELVGNAEKQGEPLTLETAPEVAVHGSYMEHEQDILEQGLSRMGRHHVHLVKELPGEKGVISGMRRNAELFVWVNVHEAIKGGLTFYESDGVILCGGQNGDGTIPPAYFSIDIIEPLKALDGGLGQRRLFLASADDEPSAQHLVSDKPEPLKFDQVDQTMLPWHVPSLETVDAVLKAAQQDLATTVPALEALQQKLPSVETLSEERAQGAGGKTVSSLMERLQQITPNSTALQDRKIKVKELIISACKAGGNGTVLSNARVWRAELLQALTFKKLDLQGTVEASAIDQLTNLGGLNVRSYAVGHWLLVHHNGAWFERSVTHSARGSAQHQLKGNGGQLSITLYPWNHAPLVLPLADFEAMRARHVSTLRSQHASIVDALSGQRLDIFDQCVPIKVVTTSKHTVSLKKMTKESETEESKEKSEEEENEKKESKEEESKKEESEKEEREPVVTRTEQPSFDLAKVNEVGGLASWLLATHAARRDATDAGHAACLLLTAPPAAGKTCLMSQLVMHVLKSEECDMVPILIKVQELQRHLLNKENRLVFEQSWNWVDAFLQCVHGANSDQYRMLRQALMARRALVLLDGIDEGGKARDAIERHVTEVLAPQGHVMLVTSRPAGLDEERFCNHFERVQLEPLSEAQQEEVIAKRLGKGKHSDLLEYLRNPKHVPLDNNTQQRVTGNPLMLSMVISIFQSKKGTESAMPATITELYETASRAMLERVDRKERGAAASAAAVPHLTSLLEATFFEAHAAEVRDFGDAQLNRAALALFAPDRLEELERKELELNKEKQWESDWIKVSKVQSISFEVDKIVQYQGKEMVVSKAVDSDGEIRLKKSLVHLKRELKQLGPDVACAELPAEAKEALRAVRERVAQDRLPLLSLLEAEPLQMRSSHLSFQEYFTVRAICTGQYRLRRESPPWKWGPFWANVVKLGRENGTTFGSGLLRAAGVEGDELNLSRDLGGDRPTVLAVVCALMGSLRVLDLSDNKLSPEGGAALVEGLKDNSALTELK